MPKGDALQAAKVREEYKKLKQRRHGLNKARPFLCGCGCRCMLVFVIMGFAALAAFLIFVLPFSIKVSWDLRKTDLHTLDPWTGPPLTFQLDQCTLALDTFEKPASLFVPKFCIRHLQMGIQIATGGFSDAKVKVDTTTRIVSIQHTGDIFRRYDRYKCEITLCLDVTKPIPDLVVEGSNTGPSEVVTIRSDLGARLRDRFAHMTEYNSRTARILTIQGNNMRAYLNDINFDTINFNANEGLFTGDRLYCRNCNANSNAQTALTVYGQASGVVTGSPPTCLAAANIVTDSGTGSPRSFDLRAVAPFPTNALPSAVMNLNIPNTTSHTAVTVMNSLEDLENSGNMNLQVSNRDFTNFVDDSSLESIGKIRQSDLDTIRALFVDMEEEDPLFDYMIIKAEGVGASCGIWVWTSHHTFHKFPDAFLATYTFGLLAGSVRKVTVRYDSAFCPSASPRVPGYITPKGTLSSYALRRLRTEFRTIEGAMKQAVGGAYFGHLAFRSYLAHCPSEILDMPIGFEFSTEQNEYIPLRLGAASTDKLFGAVYVLSLIIANLLALVGAISLLIGLQSLTTVIGRRHVAFLTPQCSHPIRNTFFGRKCKFCKEYQETLDKKPHAPKGVKHCSYCQKRACTKCERIAKNKVRVFPLHWSLPIALGMSPHVCTECSWIALLIGPFQVFDYILLKLCHLYKDRQLSQEARKNHMNEEVSAEMASVHKYLNYCAEVNKGTKNHSSSTPVLLTRRSDQLDPQEVQLLMDNYKDFCILFNYQPVARAKMVKFLKVHQRGTPITVRHRNMNSFWWSLRRASFQALCLYTPILAPMIYGLVGLFGANRIFRGKKALSFTELVLGGQWIFQGSMYITIAYSIVAVFVFFFYFLFFNMPAAFQTTRTSMISWTLDRFFKKSYDRKPRDGEAMGFYRPHYFIYVESVLRVLYLLALLAAVYQTLFHLSSSLLWLGLGMIIRPQRVAPYAVGVTALVVFALTGKSALNKMRRAMYEALRQGVEKRVNEVLGTQLSDERAYLNDFKATSRSDFERLWNYNEGDTFPLMLAGADDADDGAMKGSASRSAIPDNMPGLQASGASVTDLEAQESIKTGKTGKRWGRFVPRFNPFKKKQQEKAAQGAGAAGVAMVTVGDEHADQDAHKDGIPVQSLWFNKSRDVKPNDLDRLYAMLLDMRNRPGSFGRVRDNPLDDGTDVDEEDSKRGTPEHSDDDDKKKKGDKKGKGRAGSSSSDDGSSGSGRGKKKKKDKKKDKKKAKGSDEYTYEEEEEEDEGPSKKGKLLDSAKRGAKKGVETGSKLAKSAAGAATSLISSRFGRKQGDADDQGSQRGSDAGSDSRDDRRPDGDRRSDEDSYDQRTDEDSGFFSGVTSFFGLSGGGGGGRGGGGDGDGYYTDDDGSRGSDVEAGRPTVDTAALQAKGQEAADAAKEAAGAAKDKAAAMGNKLGTKMGGLGSRFGGMGKKGKAVADDSAADDGGYSIDIDMNTSDSWTDSYTSGSWFADDGGAIFARKRIDSAAQGGVEQEIGKDDEDDDEDGMSESEVFEIPPDAKEQVMHLEPMYHSRHFTLSYVAAMVHNISRQVTKHEFVRGMTKLLGGQPQRWARAFDAKANSNGNSNPEAMEHEKFQETVPVIVDELALDALELKFPSSQGRLVLAISIATLTVILAFYFLGLALFSLRGVTTAVIGSLLPALTSAGYGVIRKRNQDAEVEEEKSDMDNKLEAVLKTLISIGSVSVRENDGDDAEHENAQQLSKTRSLSFEDWNLILGNSFWIQYLRPKGKVGVERHNMKILANEKLIQYYIAKWRAILLATHPALEIRRNQNAYEDRQLMEQFDKFSAWQNRTGESEAARENRRRTAREELCHQWEELHGSGNSFDLASILGGIDTLLQTRADEDEEEAKTSIQDVLTMYVPPKVDSAKDKLLRWGSRFGEGDGGSQPNDHDYRAKERRRKQQQTTALTRTDLWANDVWDDEYSDWEGSEDRGYYRDDYQGGAYYDYSDYSDRSGSFWPF